MQISVKAEPFRMPTVVGGGFCRLWLNFSLQREAAKESLLAARWLSGVHEQARADPVTVTLWVPHL